MSELAARSSEPSVPDATPAAARGELWLYLGRASVHPTGAMAFLLGICLGMWIGGALGLMLGMAGSISLIVAAAGTPQFRRLLDAHMAARERNRRALQRERRLRLASPLRRAEFAELACMVEEIAARDAAQAERLELDDLLDYHAELAIAHQRIIEAVQRADRAPLWEAGIAHGAAAAELAATDATRQRQDILARRLRHRDECRKRAANLADELDAVAEFLHLVNELTGCLVLEVAAHRELDRRLWELHAHESAMRQLDAA